MDGSDGIRNDGSGQVEEARAHSIDPTTSAAQSVSGKLHDRRSRDMLSSQFSVSPVHPYPRRFSCWALPFFLAGMVRTMFRPYFFVPILLSSERLQEINGIFFAAIVTLRYKFCGLLSGDLG